MTGRGRPPGTLVRGSLPWQLSQLEVRGAPLLVIDAPDRAAHLSTQVARYEAAHGGSFQVLPCVGATIARDRMPFRFYLIERYA